MKRRFLAAAGAAFLSFSGCAARNFDSPEHLAEIATGLGQPIVFRADAGALDSSDTIEDTLSLGEAVRLTAKNNPRIQAALSRVRLAEAESDQARLLPNPIVSIALRFPTKGGGTPEIDAGLAAEFISLLQQPGRVSAADHRLRAEAASAVGTVLDVLAELRERYVGVQTLDALVAVQQDRQRIVKRLLELARARFTAGEATQLDLTTLETQRVELETEIADKELERSEERMSLSRLIGQPSGAAAWAVTKWEPSPETKATERQWAQLALENRPEVAVREYELRALGAERSLTRLSPFQTTDVGLSAQRQPDWSIGPAASLPIPIFDMGQATRSKARAAVIEARHKLQDAQQDAIEEARKALLAYTASKDILARVQNELIPLQERRLNQAEAQYRTGHTEITSLFLAEQDLQAARGRMIELQRRSTTALIRLERTAGGHGIVQKAFGDSTPTTVPATTQNTP